MWNIYDGERPENVRGASFPEFYGRQELIIQWEVVAAVLVFLPVEKMILRQRARGITNENF